MTLDKIFGFLVPKDRKFFPLFNEAADNLVYASGLLVDLIGENDLEKREELRKTIKQAEQKGDNITHQLLDELNGTFITPFDREDIHALIATIDDVVDYIHTTSTRIHYFKLETHPKEFLIISEMIVSAAKEIQYILRNVKHATDFQKHKSACKKISRYESDVDSMYQEYLSSLFESETDAIKLIKKRDILAALEKAIDKCDDVADVFQTIMVKIS